MIYKKGFFGEGIIATIRDEQFVDEVVKSEVKIVFLLTGNIFNLENVVRTIQESGKFVFVNIDFLEGLSKDYMAVDFISKRVRPDGIITAKKNLISIAKEMGIYSIFRINVVDSASLKFCNEIIVQAGPDALELTPGIIHKVTRLFKANYKIPIITGGLIETDDDIVKCRDAGADGIATSNAALWDIRVF